MPPNTKPSTRWRRCKAFIARAYDTGVLALKTETNTLDPLQASLCGLALAVAPNEAAYLPLGHRDASDSEASGLFAAKLCQGQIAEAEALAALKAVLEDDSITKIGHDIKRDWLVLARRGVHLGTTDDVMLMSYVLDAGKGSHDAIKLAERYFGREPSRFKDVKNKDKALFTPEATPIERTLSYAAEDTDMILRLWQALKPRMAAEQVVGVYETLERPMPRTLARMEERGISIDRDRAVAAVRRIRHQAGRAAGRDRQDRRPAGQCRLSRSNSATSCSAR